MNHLELGPGKQSFTGLWQLESYTEASNLPSREPPFHAPARGILIYTGDDWMSAQLTIPNRPLPGTGAEDSVPCSQFEDLGRGYLAYCGRYHLDLEHSEVIHVPEVVSLQEMANQPQRRRFVFFAADRLQLTAESVLVDGTVLSTHLTWRRSTPSSHENGQLMTESEVMAVHRKGFYKALLAQDYTALAELYLDDYVLVRPNGAVLNKQQVLDDLRETGLQFTAIDLIAEKVRIFGTTAIITGESRTEFVRDGKLGTDRFFMTAIYIQTPSDLRLAHFQSTPRVAVFGS